MKRIITFILAFILFLPSTANAAEIPAKCGFLIDKDTGTVMFEKNPDEQVAIASVTKIMTMLLIMEAIDRGELSLDELVTASANAQSYGGSTMFLEAGEQFTVHEMLKGIAVASANDGCVAMAEHISGSEEAFVELMNKRAAELGMTNTHFANTNGLDEDNHYSSARDVAIMSAELIKHEKIYDYTKIWMDELRGGKTQLVNTNRLVRFYKGATGLKTGSTDKALCCLSATAERDNLSLIAVVLGASNSNERFSSATSLLDYGFATYAISEVVTKGEEIATLPVNLGKQPLVKLIAKDSFSHLEKKTEHQELERKISLPNTLSAPVAEGETIGKISLVNKDGETVGEVDVICPISIEKKGFFEILAELLRSLLV